MKKVYILALLWALILSAASAEGQVEQTVDNRIHIGIATFVRHAALDACERGIQDALRTRGIDAVFDLQNADRDMGAAMEIAYKFKRDKVDVAVGIATPIAIALSAAIKDRPVVFAAVTDPIQAGLVSSLDRGEGNVTGLSDAIPIAEHIAMFKEIAGIRTLGYIYTSSEVNSIASLEQVEAACKKQGLQLVTQSISGSVELRQAAEAIVRQVDGVYLSTDNTVFSALPILIQVFNAARKPIFSGDVTGAMGGGCLAASGFNYYKAGVAAGNMVADILNGKKPSEMPVKFLTDPKESDLLFDLDAARACGITIPARYLLMANYIFENGGLMSN
jgi:putative ABC transport system substrate-binding protein